MTTGKDDIKLAMARVLALLAGREPMTVAEISEALELPARTVQAALRDLCTTGRAARVGDAGKRYKGAARYAAVNGSRASGTVSERWTGTDWSTATLRPGCLDYERIPSRRGDQRVPYQPPQYYMTSNVKAFAQEKDK